MLCLGLQNTILQYKYHFVKETFSQNPTLLGLFSLHLFVIGRIQDDNVFLLNILGMFFDYILMSIRKFLILLKLDNYLFIFILTIVTSLNMTEYNVSIDI